MKDAHDSKKGKRLRTIDTMPPPAPKPAKRHDVPAKSANAREKAQNRSKGHSEGLDGDRSIYEFDTSVIPSMTPPRAPDEGHPGNPNSHGGRHGEDRLLADFCRWAWNTYPDARRTWWHVPNETTRTKGESLATFRRRLAVLKAKGVVKGALDIHGITAGRFWLMEFKVGDNGLSADQMKFVEAVVSQGAITYRVYTLEEAKEIFTQIMQNIWPIK